jgi:hypothetical protein
MLSIVTPIFTVLFRRLAPWVLNTAALALTATVCALGGAAAYRIAAGANAPNNQPN